MGTPDFALPCLDALNSRYGVAAVVTQPDKPKGRGYILTPSPVKVYAAEHGIPVYQPQTLRGGAFENELREIDPDIIVVAAFGQILPEYVLNYPEYGCINIHGSLLPEYRGAAPMQRAIIDGKKQTGITTMYMAKGLDTGDMLEKAVIDIEDEDSFESIHDKLATLGAKLILSTIEKLINGEISPEKQDDSKATYASKIEKSDCLVDFSKSARQIHDLIRGLSPFPLAYSDLNGRIIKFVRSKITDMKCEGPCGTVLSIDGGLIVIACGEGAIGISALLPEGKSRMSAADFIRGRQIAPGDRFGSDKQ